jgi:hypothetical protein
MAPVEHIEQVLQRLVPCALSLRATRGIEDCLDSLAAAADEETPAPECAERPAARRRHCGWRFGLGSAAALAAGVLTALWWWPDPLESGRVAASAEAPQAEELELIREVSRMESAVDEGTLADDDGGMHRVLRYRVVGEAYVRQPRSGDVVRVVEPREEVVLVPVTAF